MSTYQHIEYDLIIIGGGPGGYVAAIRASQLGIKTALIEKEKVGGTCLHRGCIPSKILLHSANLYSLCKNSKEFGVTADNISIDYTQVQKRKEKIVNKLFHGVMGLLKKNKVTVIEGEGRLQSNHKVLVYKEKREVAELKGSHIILATGSIPFLPEGITTDGKCVMDSDDILNVQSMPDSIIIAGGGAIGVEFGSFFTSIGGKVSIVERKKHLLPMEDISVSASMEKIAEKKGIDIATSTSLTCATSLPRGVKVELNRDGKNCIKTADILLIVLGRVPFTEDIGIEQSGIEMEGRFIKVDEKQETTCPGVFAIGDLTGPLLLAHAASGQGLAVVNHIAGKTSIPINYKNIPRVTYSSPQVASVGVTQQEAEEKGYRIKTAKFPFMANGRAATLGDDSGFVKIISNKDNGKIVGVHMIGPEVSELISEIPFALNSGATYQDLFSTIHPHPTLSEVIQEALYAIDGKAIHI